MKPFAIALLSGSLLLAGCTFVDAGHVGVKVNSWSGKVNPEPLTAGLTMVLPGETVYEFPMTVDNIILDDVRVNTKEGQELTVDLRVQYRPTFNDTNDLAPKLYLTYKKPFEGSNGIIESRWKPIIMQASGYAFSQYGMIDLYQSRGAGAAFLMKKVLQDGLRNEFVDIDGIGDDAVKVETVAVSDVILPDAIKRSVEMKAQIEQETLSAKQQLEKSRMEAERKRIEAKGEADKKLILAQGEAKSRTALGISPEQYTQLELARIKSDALKNSPNLMIVPDGSVLDARNLMNMDRRQPRPTSQDE